MNFKKLLIILTAIAAGLSATAEKIGLVLSGGGAKGIAHVGVIQALEDADIPIDYIAGTSMGAVVGGLYSCGMSPAEILKLIESKDFASWSSGQIDPLMLNYFERPEPTPRLIRFQVDLQDSTKVNTSILPASLISPIPMNIAFVELFAPYTKACGGDFNKLFVPLRTVTSDVYHKHKIVCRRGRVSDAVRASMSFPLVFKPIEMDSVLVFDGGIYDNFPVDVMQKEFNPDFMVGVSVSGPDKPPVQGDLFGQLEDMIIQNNDYSMPAANSVKIQVPVLQFAVLDFGQAQKIYDIGYATGQQYVDSIKSRIKARRTPEEVARRRQAFASGVKPVVFDSIRVSGCNEPQAEYIRDVFGARSKQPVTMNNVRESYYTVISTDKVSDLFPQALFTADGKPVLDLTAKVHDNVHFGAGGWLTSGASSMIYLTGGFSTLRRHSSEADLHLWLGQSYLAAMLKGRITFPTPMPSALQLAAVVSRQKYYQSEVMFYDLDKPSTVVSASGWAKGAYGVSVERSSKASLSVGYSWNYNKFLSDFTTGGNQDSAHSSMWQVAGCYDSNTLNHSMFATSGTRIKASAQILGIDSRSGLPQLRSSRKSLLGLLQADYTRYFRLLSPLSLGVSAHGVFTLGGINGEYGAMLVEAPRFAPTPSVEYYFNPALSGYNYLAATLTPVWSLTDRLQLRGSFSILTHVREAAKSADGLYANGKWMGKVTSVNEVAVVYVFPFATLSAYCNYLNRPHHDWNFGIAFGLNFRAPRFIN